MNTKGHCYPNRLFFRQYILSLGLPPRHRDVEEIMKMRGVQVDYATIQRWVYKLHHLFSCKRIRENVG